MNTKRSDLFFRLVLGLALIALLTFGRTQPVQADSAAWAITHPMLEPHLLHTATLLPDGRVLVVGGFGDDYLASAELYNPATGFWTSTGSLAVARAYHTATLLPNGNVLVTGGESISGALASAEVYDPATGVWTNTEALSQARSFHTATLLSNGLVLIVGGIGSGGYLASAELYDPATSPAAGFWTDTDPLTQARVNHTATLLSNGLVLIAGGDDASGFVTSAELYDPATSPATGFWTDTDPLTPAPSRSYHTSTLLSDGQVLVAGGMDNSGDLASAELYNPDLDTWTATGALTQARSYHTATRLSDGKVLVTSGGAGNFNFSGNAELYDPALGTWTNTSAPNKTRIYHTATLLLNGEVLVAGGMDNSGNPASPELYGVSVMPPPSTRYVATTGTDVGNGCFTSSVPCATIMHAISHAAAGNTIEIAAGTYNEAGVPGFTFSVAGVVVNKDLTLIGAGAASTFVQAAPGSGGRVMYVISGVTATIEGMTIQENGFLLGYGAGLYNEGMVTLNYSTVRNNETDIWGGGIFNSGTLTLNNSNVSDNYAGIHGGGLFNTGTMILNNSTVSGNSASNFGGGLYNEGTLTITNSTLSGNSATGNSASSGGGVMNNGGTLNLYNTILANSVYAGDCDNNFGIVTGNNNLIEATGSNACGFTDGTDGNIIGSDPNLGAPTGSPAYFPLNSNSLAIDAGDDAVCLAAPLNNASQNGVTRPQGAHCDIGSYEAQSTPPQNPVPGLSDLSPGSAQAGSADLVLSITGADFASDAVVRWYNPSTNTTTDLYTTYVSQSSLSAVVPAALLAAPGAFELSVFNPAPGGGSSTSLPFFVTQNAATISDSDTSTSTSPTGTAVASSGGSGPGTPGSLTTTATGTGTVTVAQYDSNPGEPAPFTSTADFFDVYIADNSSFSVVTILTCNLSGFSQIYWWDGGTWMLVSPQSYDSINDCVTMDLSATSSPTIAQLTGTVFGVAGYTFSGFFPPVDNLPTLNVVKAGSAIPVKFSLGGDQGLNIFAAGYPVSGSINCATGMPQDAIEVTVTAGNSSLSYNAATDTYTYVWKTDKAWTGCRLLVVRLNDGTEHVVNFKFK